MPRVRSTGPAEPIPIADQPVAGRDVSQSGCGDLADGLGHVVARGGPSGRRAMHRLGEDDAVGVDECGIDFGAAEVDRHCHRACVHCSILSDRHR